MLYYYFPSFQFRFNCPPNLPGVQRIDKLLCWFQIQVVWSLLRYVLHAFTIGWLSSQSTLYDEVCKKFFEKRHQCYRSYECHTNISTFLTAMTSEIGKSSELEENLLVVNFSSLNDTMYYGNTRYGFHVVLLLWHAMSKTWKVLDYDAKRILSLYFDRPIDATQYLKWAFKLQSTFSQAPSLPKVKVFRLQEWSNFQTDPYYTRLLGLGDRANHERFFSQCNRVEDWENHVKLNTLSELVHFLHTRSRNLDPLRKTDIVAS